ncbi:hypothetical protein DAPPUDRAFT_278344, partial [Daphnia pulex]
HEDDRQACDGQPQPRGRAQVDHEPHGDKEDGEEEVLQRHHVRQNAVLEDGLADRQPRHKRAQRQPQAQQPADEGQAHAAADDREGEELPVPRAGHRVQQPGDDPARHHGGQHHEDAPAQRQGDQARQKGGVLPLMRQQQRQKEEEDDDKQVLKDGHGQRHAGARAGLQPQVLEALQTYGRGAHGQRHGEDHRALPVRMDEGCQQRRGQHAEAHLQAATHEGQLSQETQLPQGKLQPQREHEQDDAELGHLRHSLMAFPAAQHREHA